MQKSIGDKGKQAIVSCFWCENEKLVRLGGGGGGGRWRRNVRARGLRERWGGGGGKGAVWVNRIEKIQCLSPEDANSPSGI